MITSRNNEKIKYIAGLVAGAKARRQAGLFVVEGPRMVSEIPADMLSEIIVSESYMKKSEAGGALCGADNAGCGCPVTEVSDDVFAKISDTKNPQGILALVKLPQFTMADVTGGEGPLLILERIQDPGNLGTMFRSAEAAGAAGIILSDNCVDVTSPKVIRSTMGAIFRVPFVVSAELAAAVGEAQSAGYTIYAAHLAGETFYTNPAAKKSAYMIGNEGAGLSDELSKCADKLIKIPMEGQVESLNTSVAASLLLYEWHRQFKA